MTPSLTRWIGTGLSHQGQVRTSNQDALTIDNERGLWVVADGMGGHTGGQVASALAVSAIANHIRDRPTTSAYAEDQPAQATSILSQAVSAAKKAIQERVAQEPDLRSMGTTVVAAWFIPEPTPSIAITHVGDSRAYLIHNSQLVALTTDHSLVQQLVAEGHITLEESWDHPRRNVINRALGLNFPSTPDISVHSLKPDDGILLCTDGLTKMLSDNEILATLLELKHTPEEACQRLIDRANSAGGLDNTTVLLIATQSS